MRMGLIGLGKMGFTMRARLREAGHELVGYDSRPEFSDVLRSPTVKTVSALRNQFGGHAVKRVPLSG